MQICRYVYEFYLFKNRFAQLYCFRDLSLLILIRDRFFHVYYAQYSFKFYLCCVDD